jgi:FAD/FMN-containing dehydrogenase
MSSHTKGLALDWLVGAKVVLANSTVIKVSETENADLFWAIKGAGSSIGIVAEFYFKTFDVPKTVTYFMAPVMANANKSIDAFKIIQDYAADTMPTELNMRFFITPQFSNLEGLYYGNKTELDAVLAPLLSKLGVNPRAAQSTQTDWLGQLTYYGNGLTLDQTHPYKKVSLRTPTT